MNALKADRSNVKIALSRFFESRINAWVPHSFTSTQLLLALRVLVRHLPPVDCSVMVPPASCDAATEPHPWRPRRHPCATPERAGASHRHGLRTLRVNRAPSMYP